MKIISKIYSVDYFHIIILIKLNKIAFISNANHIKYSLKN